METWHQHTQWWIAVHSSRSHTNNCTLRNMKQISVSSSLNRLSDRLGSGEFGSVVMVLLCFVFLPAGLWAWWVVPHWVFRCFFYRGQHRLFFLLFVLHWPFCETRQAALDLVISMLGYSWSMLICSLWFCVKCYFDLLISHTHAYILSWPSAIFFGTKSEWQVCQYLPFISNHSTSAIHISAFIFHWPYISGLSEGLNSEYRSNGV